MAKSEVTQKARPPDSSKKRRKAQNAGKAALESTNGSGVSSLLRLELYRAIAEQEKLVMLGVTLWYCLIIADRLLRRF